MAESRGNYAGPPGYKLLEQVGASKTGAIFKARHTLRGNLVAIKFLKPAAAVVEILVRRFQRTIQILSKLQHPNLILALEDGRQGGSPYLVMEYFDGKDLRAILKERGPLPIPLALNYVSQAAAGLGCLHDHGICHRNVKPSNMLVDAEGKLKIVGLGLAHVLDGRTLGEDSTKDSLTAEGEIVGSHGYLSPEQAVDSNKIDARADIFSLGCTLHALLTGHSPDSAQTADHAGAASQGATAPLSSSRPDAPPALDRIMQKMLARRPDDRYSSMNMVWVELSSAMTMPSNAGRTRENLLPSQPYPPATPSASAPPVSLIPPSTQVPPAPQMPAPAPAAAPPPVEHQPSPIGATPSGGIEDLIGSYQVPIKTKGGSAGKKRGSLKKKKKLASNVAFILPILVSVILVLIAGIFAAVNYPRPPEIARSGTSTVPSDSSKFPKIKSEDWKVPSTKSTAEETPQPQQPAKNSTTVAAAPKPPPHDEPAPSKDTTSKPPPDEDAEKPQKPETPAVPQARRAVPTPAELEGAMKNFQIGYKGAIESANSPDDKIALARQLIGNAADASIGAVDRYVILQQAITFAKGANDLEVAAQAVESIAKDFEVDEWKAKLDVVAEMCDAKSLRLKPEPVIEAVLSLQSAAMENHRYDIADQLSDQALKASKVSKDRDLHTRVVAAKNANAFFLKWQNDYTAAQQSLKTQPQDANANLIAGKYECFVLEKWELGLPKLKIGFKGPYDALIKSEIKQPTDPTEQADVGDLWYKYAKTMEQSKDKPMLPSVYRRAHWWYDKALAKASGLLKTRVENAIEKLPSGNAKP